MANKPEVDVFKVKDMQYWVARLMLERFDTKSLQRVKFEQVRDEITIDLYHFIDDEMINAIPENKKPELRRIAEKESDKKLYKYYENNIPNFAEFINSKLAEFRKEFLEK